MKITNKQFGEIEFEQDSIINFAEGILGFEDKKKFILISEKDGFFFWLTSVDEPELIFPLFSINLLQDNFGDSTDLEPFGIVKLDKDPEKVSINLRAPVFIDHENKTGHQTIMDDENYPVDYPLFVHNESN
jgi:flagellar assembly factor FliW